MKFTTAALLLVAASTAHAQIGAQPCTQSIFRRADEQLSWSDHLVRANRMGCELASITSEAEQEQVAEMFADARYERVWIGAARIAGTDEWQWSDGSEWSYTNWRRNEPNNAGNEENRALMDVWPTGNRLWNDVSGAYEHAAVYKCCRDDYCLDFPGWIDENGIDDCNAYAVNGWCNEYGQTRGKNTRKTANQACCACGGGIVAST